MKNLQILRKERGLTQIEAAEKLGLTYRTYQNLEYGYAETSFENLTKIADYFGCSVDYLLGHQTQSVLYLDNFTDSQRTLISMIGSLNEDQTNNLIGRASEMLNLPYSSIKPVRPW